MKVEIIRKPTAPVCSFQKHFRNFEHVDAVQQIFGDTTHDVLANLEVEFTEKTLYMRVDYDARLLINPHYFERGKFIDLYLDVIHELVHIQQVFDGKDSDKAIPYVQRPQEIEAYQTAVNEARALGLDETQIIDYLESDLINNDELKQLATSLGISWGQSDDTLSQETA